MTGAQTVGGRGLPELLAPAGGLGALLAAVAAGADAIYAGYGAFNARVSARGFTDEDFAYGCAVAHAHGVRVYAALNVFVFDGELDAAVETGRRALALGADALIVADLGLIVALRHAIPGVEIHLSTQAGVHAPEAVALVAEELGVERVTTARELTVEEIAELCAVGVPIEVFCHGAICISYSGACEFSALRRGRSAMRGDCTQPCRLSYGLEDGEGRTRVAVEGDRLLCPRDYLGLRHLPELVAAGVASLKIEGRMKNPDYVYNVVATWRRALDLLAAGEWSDEAARGLERDLGRSFNRGFTDAYLRGRSGAEMMSFERAINQGVRVGRLVAVGHDEVTVELDASVAAGDTLEIRFYPGADAPRDVPKRWPQVPCPVDAAAGERIRVHCKRKVDTGCEVYLIRSAGVLAQTARALETIRETKTSGTFVSPACGLDDAEARPDVPASVLRDAALAERARGAGVDAATSSVAGDGGSGAGVSGASGRSAAVPAGSALASIPAEAERLLAAGSEAAVYAWRLADDPAWGPLLGHMTVVLDEVCRSGERERAVCLMRRAARVVCRNLEQVALARREGVAFDVAAPVFCASRATVDALRALGAGRIFLPAELAPAGEVVASAAGLSGASGVYAPVDTAHPELMVCEHCVLTAEGPCAGECAACERRRAPRYLVERDGTRLPIAVDSLGRTRIFNV